MTPEPHPRVSSCPPPTNRSLYLATGIAALAGLLFGYDTAVVSGAIGFLEVKFQLTPAMAGWVASVLLLGCAIGTVISGKAGDAFGRKPVLMATGILFGASAIWSGCANSVSALAYARFVGGIAIGAASMLAPAYLAEIAPASKRGRLVTLYQMGIVVGILTVFIVNWWIQRQGDHTWNVEFGWRLMFAALAVPSVGFAVGLLAVPESPRWLFMRGRRAEAEHIASRLYGADAAKSEMEAWAAADAGEAGTRRSLFQKSLRRPLLIGGFVAIASQTSGINAIMYYAPEIFKASGAHVDSAFLQTISVGAINLLFTILAFFLVDRIGRRSLLTIGTSLQLLALSTVSVLFALEASPSFFLIPILLFVAAFAMSTGAVTWILISEIFPNRVRAQAMAFAVTLLWIADWVVTQTFPILRESAGPSATFALYAMSSALTIVFTVFFVPETRGRSLEEIENQWTHQ